MCFLVESILSTLFFQNSKYFFLKNFRVMSVVFYLNHSLKTVFQFFIPKHIESVKVLLSDQAKVNCQV